MGILYLDCSMGAAGDMLTAALLELVPDKNEVMAQLNDLGIPEVVFEAEESVKCGIKGTHMSVKVHGEEEESMDVHDHHEHHHDHEHDHEHHHDHDDDAHDHHHDHEHEHDHHHDHHHHSSMHDIEHIVRDHLKCSDKVKDDILAVYKLIAEAESHVHGVPVDRIHFHEVGTMDAIADIAAVCILMEKLSCDRIVVSPVHVGSGQVRCAHGILPVPAPATAFILNDIPIYGGKIRGELCTPTGAALLKHFAGSFGDMPVMSIKAVGYGMGKKDFEAANCVRAILGEDFMRSGSPLPETDKNVICELSCNVDDMTGEEIGYAMERLFEAGAREVYTIPVGMKKNRPGIMLSVMCSEEDKDRMIEEIFKNTTTLGIRENIMSRYTLERSVSKIETPYGDVRIKRSSGYGVDREKLEYDDLAALAAKNGVSLRNMRESVISKTQSDA